MATYNCQYQNMQEQINISTSYIETRLSQFQAQNSKYVDDLMGEYKIQLQQTLMNYIDNRFMLNEIQGNKAKTNKAVNLLETLKKDIKQIKVEIYNMKSASPSERLICEEELNKHYEVGIQLLGKQNNIDKCTALNQHLKIALIQYSAQKSGEEMFKLMKPVLNAYQLMKIQQPLLKPNFEIKQINLDQSMVADDGCVLLMKTNYPNLNDLRLTSNSIGDKGCQYLSRAHWPQLTKISLGQNKIGSEGCLYLIQGKWPNLILLDIQQNKIDNQSCKYLSKGNWPNLNEIYLGQNQIGSEGLRYLCKGDWINLTMLDLWHNIIDDEGIKALQVVKWPQLKDLILNHNNLTKNKWTKSQMKKIFPKLSEFLA